MDDFLDDIVRVAERCERAAKAFDNDPVLTICKRLEEGVKQLQDRWSGSNLGYHAFVYTKGLHPKRGHQFDIEWGLQQGLATQTTDGWQEYDYQTIERAIFSFSGVADLSLLHDAAEVARKAFEEGKQEFLPTLDAIIATHDDELLREQRKIISKTEPFLSAADIQRASLPRNMSTRDTLAGYQGVRPAHHIRFHSEVLSAKSCGTQAMALAKSARYVVRYLQQRHKMKGDTVAKTDGAIFIGHGHSHMWMVLRDFIEKKLGRECIVYESVSTAGMGVKDRLEEMLDQSCFAFLIMTAEDEQADGTKRARENVIHEVGLFQGRLTFKRAIVMLEEGCNEFSNIQGLGEIRFPKGKIDAVFEQIRDVLKREKIIF